MARVLLAGNARADALRLVCSPALAAQLAEPDLRFIAGGVTELFGEMEPGRCRVCGSRRFKPLRGESAVSLAADCLCAH